jgi:hypothetical protein
MPYRTYFAYQIDLWDTNGKNVVEHLAGVEDLLDRDGHLPLSGETLAGRCDHAAAGREGLRTVVKCVLLRGMTRGVQAGVNASSAATDAQSTGVAVAPQYWLTV